MIENYTYSLRPDPDSPDAPPMPTADNVYNFSLAGGLNPEPEKTVTFEATGTGTITKLTKY